MIRDLAIALVALGLAASGCQTPCEELGRRICACRVAAGTPRDACDRAVRDAAMDPVRTSAEQHDLCDATLKTCPDPGKSATACDDMQTCQGKVDCGLAAPGACGP